MSKPVAVDQPDARDLGLVSLAMAAGGMDVLAFTHLANVLPSAMTGNTALLGLALVLAGFLLRRLSSMRPFGGGHRDMLIVPAACATAMQGIVARLNNWQASIPSS